MANTTAGTSPSDGGPAVGPKRRRSIGQRLLILLGAIVLGVAVGVVGYAVFGLGGGDDGPSQEVIDAEAAVCAPAHDGAIGAAELSAAEDPFAQEAARGRVVIDAELVGEALDAAPDDIDASLRSGAGEVATALSSLTDDPATAEAVGTALTDLSGDCEAAGYLAG